MRVSLILKLFVSVVASLGWTVRAEEFDCPTVLSAERIEVLAADGPLSLQLRRSPFTLTIVNEHALGLYASISYAEPMTNPEEGPWKIWERSWVNQEWATSIESVCWRPSEGVLFLSSECVYGSCSIYRLTPRDKKSEPVLRADPAKNQAVDIAPCSKIKARLCGVVSDSDTGAILEEKQLMP